MNNVVLIGRLTKDPELRYIPTGTAVSMFTLAVDRGLSKEKKQEMESNNKPTADFIRIKVWGKVAENVANYLEKGRLVGVQGRIQTGFYNKDDNTRVYTTEVIATNVEFLEWGDKKKEEKGQDEYWDGYIEQFHPTDNDDIPF